MAYTVERKASESIDWSAVLAVMTKQEARNHAIGPNGVVLLGKDMPPPGFGIGPSKTTTHWTTYTKLQVVMGVRQGVIELAWAQQAYLMSFDEFLQWQDWALANAKLKTNKRA